MIDKIKSEVFNITFHVDIDMQKHIHAYFYCFLIFLYAPLLTLSSSGDPHVFGENL